MDIVYHYPLSVEAGPFTLRIPKKHRFLLVGERQGRPTAWYLVDPSTPETSLELYTAYTGKNNRDLTKMKYLGSVRTSWSLVFHYFEEDK